MSDEDLSKAIKRLLKIFDEVEAGGMMAAIKHKVEIEALCPVVLREIDERLNDGK